MSAKKTSFSGQTPRGSDKFTVDHLATLLRVKMIKFDRINGNDIFLVSHNQH